MTQRYRKFKRSWGMWYAFDNVTGNSVSLKTRMKAETGTKIAAMNETERQPSISFGLAKVYLNATDPKLATRTWLQAIEAVTHPKRGAYRERWERVAMGLDGWGTSGSNQYHSIRIFEFKICHPHKV